MGQPSQLVKKEIKNTYLKYIFMTEVNGSIRKEVKYFKNVQILKTINCFECFGRACNKFRRGNFV